MSIGSDGGPPDPTMTTDLDRPAHWNDRYERIDYHELAWYSPDPFMSIRLIEASGVERSAPVIEAGAGAALLVDRLVERGFTNLTAADVSCVALQIARERVGDDAPVEWLCADLMEWGAGRQWELWHERALFHFVNRVDDIARYCEMVARCVAPGGWAVIGTFGPEGPLTCSALPVARYTADELAALFAPAFELVEAHTEDHVTPAGLVQPYTWVLMRRAST